MSVTEKYQMYITAFYKNDMFRKHAFLHHRIRSVRLIISKMDINYNYNKEIVINSGVLYCQKFSREENFAVSPAFSSNREIKFPRISLSFLQPRKLILRNCIFILFFLCNNKSFFSFLYAHYN